jgi:SAM-dependent methyltransferase
MHVIDGGAWLIRRTHIDRGRPVDGIKNRITRIGITKIHGQRVFGHGAAIGKPPIRFREDLFPVLAGIMKPFVQGGFVAGRQHRRDDALRFGNPHVVVGMQQSRDPKGQIEKWISIALGGHTPARAIAEVEVGSSRFIQQFGADVRGQRLPVGIRRFHQDVEGRIVETCMQSGALIISPRAALEGCYVRSRASLDERVTKMNTGAAKSFEQDFLSQALGTQIDSCDRYELAPLFLELFKNHQPVLEAGCGSGRWNGWLSRHKIRSDGVDWSEELCNRARKEIPDCRFFADDMRSIPVAEKIYAGLIALGSVEHMPEGPITALREFNRILRDDGVAIITVPYGGTLRRITRSLQAPITLLKASQLIRRLFGKPTHGKSLKEARQETNYRWYPRFSFGDQGWFFYEYEFNKFQMQAFLRDTGFSIQREFVAFGNEGILHNFGRIAGRWNPERADVDFGPIGRILRKLLPVSFMGHMLCYVVTKGPSNN